MSPAARLLDLALPAVFVTYLVLVGVYLVLQVSFAERARRRRGPAAPDAQMPSVDIIVPCYNERPQTLAA